MSPSTLLWIMWCDHFRLGLQTNHTCFYGNMSLLQDKTYSPHNRKFTFLDASTNRCEWGIKSFLINPLARSPSQIWLELLGKDNSSGGGVAVLNAGLQHHSVIKWHCSNIFNKQLWAHKISPMHSCPVTFTEFEQVIGPR